MQGREGGAPREPLNVRIRRATRVLTSSIRLGIRSASRLRNVRINVLMDVEGSNRLGAVINEVTCDRACSVSDC